MNEIYALLQKRGAFSFIIQAQDSNLAQQLALAVACRKNHTKLASAGCADCHLITATQHPRAITLITDTATISIKQIRTALAKLSHSTDLPRLFIVTDAHKLSLPAANALLKSLEEPPTNTRFVLITPWPKRLLATIRSRCQLLKLPPPKLGRGQDGVASAVSPPRIGRGQEGVATKSLIDRLRDKKDHLDDDTLAGIAEAISAQLKSDGPSPELRRAAQRLRDYHYIRANRGNLKLAADVLLASLPARPVRR